jgi:N6-adenosine-specific RNA methylase IME4
MAYEYHEVANIFPMMSADEFSALVEDIRANGQREPIYLHEGRIIDGRNRYRACQQLGIEPDTRVWDGVGSLVAFVVSLNLQRRHLTSSQRVTVGMDALPLLEAEAKERQRNSIKERDESGRAIPVPQLIGELDNEPRERHANEAVQQAAQMVGTNRQYVSDAKRLRDEAPELLERVRSGELTIPQAKTEMKRAEVKRRLEEIVVREAETPTGLFDVIVIDPPWAMEKIERDVAPLQVGFDYPTMSEQELSTLNIPADEHCHMWLWTTHKFLPMALRLLDAWGFKYVCTFVWHKPGGFQPFGLPQFNCEFAIYARKGTPQFVDTKAFNVCFDAPRGAHSEKPDAFYDVVRRVTGGRRLDMFNRRAIDGFSTWGNEAA